MSQLMVMLSHDTCSDSPPPLRRKLSPKPKSQTTCKIRIPKEKQPEVQHPISAVNSLPLDVRYRQVSSAMVRWWVFHLSNK